jgi:hypothetical protein
MQAGIKGLKKATPQNAEERREVFLLKKHVIDILAESVTINRERELTVKLRLNLLKILEDDSGSGAVHLRQFGTYTRKRSSRAYRHPGAGSG